MISTVDCCGSAFAARRWPIAAVLFLVVVNAAAVGAQSAAEYIVGPNDVITVNVFDQPQLSGKYLVQADGTITFPLLERVKVGGLAMQQIERALRDRLADGFLKNPQVGVTVDQYRSQQIIVLGEVRNPGTFEFTGSTTLLTALARAGATTERAAHEALVIRPAAGKAPLLDASAIERARQAKDSQVIRVDLEGLQRGVLSENLVLQGGDSVFVPKAATVFVSGHVISPGEYTIREGMTVRQVLALAGGVNERGSTGRIQAIRRVGDQERTIDIRLQDAVQPNDTIVVRERFF